MRISSCVVGAVIVFGHISNAGATPFDGFEDGLSGWEFLGDVSTRGSDIGAPSEGVQQAFITTLCDSRTSAWCEVVNPESPYSGVSAINAVDAASFLGFTVDDLGISSLTYALPTEPESEIRGESGVMRTRFFASAGSVLSFDWRHYAQGNLGTFGTEGDSSYFTLWSDVPGGMRTTDYLWNGFDRMTNPASNTSAADLCARGVGNDCSTRATYDTGYLTRSIVLPSDGWYWLGFGMFEVEEGTVGSALSLDNLRLSSLNVPEPASSVLALSLLALGFARRRIARR